MQRVAIEFIEDFVAADGVTVFPKGMQALMLEDVANKLRGNQNPPIAILGFESDFPKIALVTANRAMRPFIPGQQVNISTSGSSQHSRQSVNLAHVESWVRNETLFIRTAPPYDASLPQPWPGQLVWVAVPGHNMMGRLTILGLNYFSIPAPGWKDTQSNTDTSRFIQLIGTHSGASWMRYILSRYQDGARWVLNASCHGDNVTETRARVPAARAAVQAMETDILIGEGGLGNSVNQDSVPFGTYFPIGMKNLRDMAEAVPVMFVTTLPPPDPIANPSNQAIGNYLTLNTLVTTGRLREQANNIVGVDVTTALTNPLDARGRSVPNVHSDELHWTPLGASEVAKCFFQQLDKVIPVIPAGRRSVADVFTNGGTQLFDGLLDASGATQAPWGQVSGTFDNTIGLLSKVGGGATVVGSKTARANGLFRQVLTMSGLAATVVVTVPIKGAAGATFASRLIPGETYTIALSASIAGITGKIKSVSFFATALLAGLPNVTGERLAWAGRYQQDAVEGGNGAFAQTASETETMHLGEPFTIPAGCTVSDFTIYAQVAADQASSAVVLSIEDIAFRRVSNSLV